MACRTTFDPDSDILNRSHIKSLKSAPENAHPPPKILLKKKKSPTPPLPPAMNKLVSVTLTEEIPLKDALVELARQAEIDLHLDSKVSERIICRVTDPSYLGSVL